MPQFAGMIQLPPIVCLGFPNWEGDYQKSTVQLMQALAASHRVLYVEYPFTWKDVYQGLRHGNRPWQRILGWEQRLREMPNFRGRLHVLTLPPQLPINGLQAGATYEWLAKQNARLARTYIRRAIRELGYYRPVLITAFNPFLGSYLNGQLGEQKHFYYCYDEIGAARWTQDHGPRLERRLLERVDGVIVSSDPLLEAKVNQQAALVLKNGAQISLFARAFQAQPQISETPVLGYLGNINDRVDLELLLAMLEKWPEARLLMVGALQEKSWERHLREHPQIEWVGPKQPHELPPYLEKMQLGLIPFVQNEFTRYIYPLKINEYLAAGLPVVSTNFGDLSDFSEIASVVQPSRLIEACKKALLEDSPEKRSQRLAFAQAQSWSGRAHTLAHWLGSQLEGAAPQSLETLLSPTHQKADQLT
ncbi:MAG: glycosyltransferase [Bacteroidota bacterium]